VIALWGMGISCCAGGAWAGAGATRRLQHRFQDLESRAAMRSCVL
jgi:hypothetical protein